MLRNQQSSSIRIAYIYIRFHSFETRAAIIKKYVKTPSTWERRNIHVYSKTYILQSQTRLLLRTSMSHIINHRVHTDTISHLLTFFLASI